MIYMPYLCSNCKQIIKVGEQCYQSRIGYMTMDGQEKHVFFPDKDLDYTHVECPAPHCDHSEYPIIPLVVWVINSPAYKVVMQKFMLENPSHIYSYNFIWTKTKYRERLLTIEVQHKDDGSVHEYKFAFIKCGTCGVIQSI